MHNIIVYNLKSNFIAYESGRCQWHTVMRVEYMRWQDQRDEREISDSRRIKKLIKEFRSDAFLKLRKYLGANKTVV